MKSDTRGGAICQWQVGTRGGSKKGGFKGISGCPQHKYDGIRNKALTRVPTRTLAGLVFVGMLNQ